MKILKIFGVVVGIHVFALILIFANPGCSSTSKPTPAPSDTVAKTEAAPTVNLPYSSPMTVSTGFNPDAPATASSSSTTTGTPLFRPTRPGSTAAQAVTAPPVQDVTPASTYVVKGGDTFWELGKKFHIPYADIAAANNMKSSAPLHAGQKLIIPSKPSIAASSTAPAPAKTGANGSKSSSTSTAPAASASAASGSSAYKHMVKPGETLSTIAHQYGVSVKEIVTANSISDPAKVKAGVELVIPGWTGTKGGTTKAGPTTTAAKAPEPKPTFNLLDSAPASTTPAPSGTEPPVIKIEDSPLSPTPKTK